MKKLVLSISITLTTSLCFSQGILDNYLTDQLTYVEVGSSTEGLIQPQDLDFKANSNELWVMNKVTNNSMQGNFNTTGGSFIVFYDAGLTGQTSEYRKDSHAGHFMMNASAVAFGEKPVKIRSIVKHPVSMGDIAKLMPETVVEVPEKAAIYFMARKWANLVLET